LNDGRELVTRAAFAKGSPANPMSDGELLAKFTGCLEAGGIDADTGRQAAGLILDLESQPDVRVITGLLSAQVDGRPLAGSVNPAE
jgi:hypothetical protein